jgi:hypothetical protein
MVAALVMIPDDQGATHFNKSLCPLRGSQMHLLRLPASERRARLLLRATSLREDGHRPVKPGVHGVFTGEVWIPAELPAAEEALF